MIDDERWDEPRVRLTLCVIGLMLAVVAITPVVLLEQAISCVGRRR